MTEAKLYRIWWGDNNDRREIARIKSEDLDQVKEFVAKKYLNPDTEYEELGDCDNLILSLNVCQHCDPLEYAEEGQTEEEICEACEYSEYIQIELDTWGYEEELKTIFGTNDFYDLTDPEETEKTKIYNEFLHEAWEKSPSLGVSALIVQTIKDLPHLEKGFSKELIEKSRRDLE